MDTNASTENRNFPPMSILHPLFKVSLRAKVEAGENVLLLVNLFKSGKRCSNKLTTVDWKMTTGRWNLLLVTGLILNLWGLDIKGLRSKRP